jgi:hypothetical protein
LGSALAAVAALAVSDLDPELDDFEGFAAGLVGADLGDFEQLALEGDAVGHGETPFVLPGDPEAAGCAPDRVPSARPRGGTGKGKMVGPATSGETIFSLSGPTAGR